MQHNTLNLQSVHIKYYRTYETTYNFLNMP